MDPLFIDPLILAAVGGALAKRYRGAMTKQAEIDFVRVMIPHHEEAVRKAHEAIQKGASGHVLRLARRIVAGQTKEIAEMRAWLLRAQMKSC